MKNAMCVAAAWLLMAGAVQGQTPPPIQIDVESSNLERGYLSVILKVTNNSSQFVGTAIISCAFLDKGGTAIALSKELISNLGAGASAYGRVSADIQAADKVNCRTEAIY